MSAGLKAAIAQSTSRSALPQPAQLLEDQQVEQQAGAKQTLKQGAASIGVFWHD